jgi:hypothetical protein
VPCRLLVGGVTGWFSVVRLFMLLRAEIARLAVQPGLVVALDAGHAQGFDVGQGAQRAGAQRGAGGDSLVLVKPDGRLGGGVIERVADRADSGGKPAG